MAVLVGVDDFFGLTDPCFDTRSWGGGQLSEFDGPWMVLDDGAYLNQKQEQDLLSALQPDASSASIAFEAFSVLLHTCRERVSDTAMDDDIPSVLDDRSYSTQPIAKAISGDKTCVPSPSSSSSSSSSELIAEFMRLKLADRRKRNRESSSRCYYKRKRRVAGIKEALEDARRRASFLSSRKEQLAQENEKMKKKIAALHSSTSSS